MASNKELIEQIHQLNPDADTESLSNKAMVELLAELKTPRGYRVAPGKAITSRVGVLKDGDAVEAKQLAGGHDTLVYLVSRGYCVETE